MRPYAVPFAEIGRADVETVGGKNSSLGEMLRELRGLGVAVPDGYATTVDAYRDFLRQGGLDERISQALGAGETPPEAAMPFPESLELLTETRRHGEE